MASNDPGGKQHFVDQHREQLIQKITMVHPVLDSLLQEGLLTQEHYDIVMAERIPQEKMRKLYEFSRGWSSDDKETFYQALKDNNPGVMENLEGTSLSAKLKKTTSHDMRLSDFGKEYRESVEKMFQRIPEYNSRMGEAVSLQKRYTKLLMRKGRQKKEEKEQELRSTDRGHLQDMEERSSDEYSPITIQDLFAPDEERFIPNIVVLEGPAGIGKTMTSIYLLYLEVLLTHHSKKDQPVDGRPHVVTTCLRKLCALANEGVLKQQILFKEEDLQRHGLSLCEVESVFLNENIFRWDVRTQTCYSFIHLSVQEFLAALYYGLDDGSGNEGRRKDSLPLTISEGKSLREIFIKHSHLALAVKFLFGLLNEKMVKTFSRNTDINISLPARSVIIKWVMKDMNRRIYIDDIVCLYETQDGDFIRRVMSQSSDLMVEGTRYDSKRNVRNYSNQLDYCLKTLKSESFLSVDFDELTLDPECQKSLSLIVHRSQRVWFLCCKFHRWYGEDEDSSSSGHDEGSSSSGHKMVPEISFLISPESKIKELRFTSCGLTSSSCDVLRSILITNRSLTSLYLSCNNVQDSGIKLLCEGLRHPDCTLQELSITDCGATLSYCDDLCSVITTNRNLTRLYIALDDDEKMSDSEVARCCEVLQHVGFTVDRWGGFWYVSMDRRRR